VPIVRATGGLADTIVGYDEQTAAAGLANGFSFQEYSSLAFSETLRQACDVYRKPEVWNRLISTGMKQDWSWNRSAKQYAELYKTTIARFRQTTI
jgi:starch synthase